MKGRTRTPRRPARGLTLLELILAVGLLSVLVAGVLQLLDTSVTLWDKTETRRDLVEIGSSVTELLASDLKDVHGGARGDLLFEWQLFDTNADRIAAVPWPRLRLVRVASAAELQDLGGSRALDVGDALIEVCWAVLPEGGLAPGDPRRAQGVLWRAERVTTDGGTSFFAEDFFGARGAPPPGTLHEVTGGILWLAVQFATQTSLVREEWKVGTELEDAAASWDAWTRGRPDASLHPWNERSAGLADARDVPVLPRRVRVELEIERPRDVKRRPVLKAAADRDDVVFRVSDASRLPADGSFLLVDEEWVRLVSRAGSRVTVRRAARGTRAANHAQGSVVHFGAPTVREVPVALFREDWNL